MENSEGRAAKWGSGDPPQADSGEDGDHFCTKTEETFLVKDAGGVHIEVPTKPAVLELYLVSAESALQLVRKEERKKIESIIPLNSEAYFQADAFCWQTTEADDCNPAPHGSRNEEIAEHSFRKNSKSESSSSKSAAVL